MPFDMATVGFARFSLITDKSILFIQKIDYLFWGEMQKMYAFETRIWDEEKVP